MSGANQGWSDGKARAMSPREAMAHLLGGFDEAAATAALADNVILAYLNRFLTRYHATAHHLPYVFQHRVDAELAEPSDDGDWDLRVALAIGYGVPDDVIDDLQRQADLWDLETRMGAVPFEAGIGLRETVTLGESAGDAERGAASEEAWDVRFQSQRCTVLVRRGADDHTLAVRCEIPDHDGLYEVVLRFPGGGAVTLHADVVRGVWRKGGVTAPEPGLPASCVVRRM